MNLNSRFQYLERLKHFADIEIALLQLIASGQFESGKEICTRAVPAIKSSVEAYNEQYKDIFKIEYVKEVEEHKFDERTTGPAYFFVLKVEEA
jgi:hypothetical protein